MFTTVGTKGVPRGGYHAGKDTVKVYMGRGHTIISWRGADDKYQLDKSIEGPEAQVRELVQRTVCAAKAIADEHGTEVEYTDAIVKLAAKVHVAI